jgi:hypothetical protein
MEGDATFLSRNQRPVFVHGFVHCPEGRFDILKLHNRSNETILDVTLTTTDHSAEALLRRNLGIAQGSPLRVCMTSAQNVANPMRCWRCIVRRGR